MTTPAAFAPAGRNLVPAGYVGPVVCTGAFGKEKVRYVSATGHVWRDSKFSEGRGKSLDTYAQHYVVRPVQLVTPTLTP